MNRFKTNSLNLFRGNRQLQPDLKFVFLILMSCLQLPVLASGQIAPPLDWRDEPLWPLPLTQDLDQEKVALGKRLFNDTRLSHDNTISCAFCHSLSTGGVDRLPRSIGINNAMGGINAPTVLNSGFNFVQFWDGRAATLEEQAAGPINNPVEMGSNWDEVLEKLGRDPDYKTQFAKIYPDGMTPETITHAISEFERSLITPNSPFDHFLRGDGTAISEVEKEGYQLFKEIGCASCHQGKMVGGNMYERMGIVRDYFATKETVSEADLGRFNVTGDPEDKHEFKVPSLRNVALTPPYFHDASAPDLHTAVIFMARYQLGRDLSPADADRLVAFLKTLTGVLEAQ